MCYFITVELNRDVDPDRVSRILKRYALPRLVARRESALRSRHLGPDRVVYTGEVHCDCDTTLAQRNPCEPTGEPSIEAGFWAEALHEWFASGEADRVGLRVVWWGEVDRAGDRCEVSPLTAQALVEMEPGVLYEFVS